jgi:hypothetical protein
MSPQDAGREVVRKKNPGLASLRVLRVQSKYFLSVPEGECKKKRFFSPKECEPPPPFPIAN